MFSGVNSTGGTNGMEDVFRNMEDADSSGSSEWSMGPNLLDLVDFSSSSTTTTRTTDSAGVSVVGGGMTTAGSGGSSMSSSMVQPMSTEDTDSSATSLVTPTMGGFSSSWGSSSKEEDQQEDDTQDQEEKLVDRKYRHRHTEKLRRERINQAVDQIQLLCNCSKGDKAAVLSTAVKCLKRDRNLSERLAAMQRENAELKEQLAQMSSSVIPSSSSSGGGGGGGAGGGDNGAQSSSQVLGSFDNVFHGNGMPMCLVNLDLTIMDMNKAFADMIGAPRQLARPLTCTQLSPVSDFHKLFALMQKLMSGTVASAQMLKKLKTLNGDVIDVVTTLMLVREDGQPKCILATIMPVNRNGMDDVELEAQNRQIEAIQKQGNVCE